MDLFEGTVGRFGRNEKTFEVVDAASGRRMEGE
jgi:hypothetical protein